MKRIWYNKFRRLKSGSEETWFQIFDGAKSRHTILKEDSNPCP